jgi:hypothetical protein
MKPSDLSVNPYNFQVPVSKPEAFAGRKSQRDDIAYYLDQALKTRPTNIAIVGPRAAGKTSLLNMIARDAVDRGIVTVRINFTESHARSQLRFFFKVFDALVSEVVKQRRASDGERCFGGPGGRFFELYAECLTTFERASLDELELMFPNIYASAMKSGNEDRIVVPQSFFEDDLRRVADEAGRPIALIMDECNVFVQNREILQAMRGMFQNLERYMLVMTGTNEMFPVIDEIYSPVGRGFKRISLEGFSSEKDTFSCMERPCLAMGVDADVLDEFRPRKDEKGDEVVPPALADLHRFTSGNPHEIQLACHFMFRDIQERASRIRRIQSSGEPIEGLGFMFMSPLTLNSSVIANVLKELAPDEERRETLARVQSLEDSALQALGLLTRVGFGFSRKTYYGFVESERVMTGSDGSAGAGKLVPLTTESLDAGLHSLLVTGWLCEAESDAGFRWNAPQLEEVLLKYVARSKRVTIGGFGSKSLLEPYLAWMSRTPRVPVPMEDFVWLTPWTASLPEGASREGVVAIPDRLRGRALHVIHNRCEVAELACFTPERGWTVRLLILFGTDLAEGLELLEELERSIANANDAASCFGVRWSLVRSTLEAKPPWGSEPSDWMDPLQDAANFGCTTWMFCYHTRICDEFLAGKDVAQAVHCLLPHLPSIKSSYASNFAFIALAYGLSGTRESLKQVVGELEESALAKYNLALSALFAEPDGLVRAVDELRAMNLHDKSDGFRAMLLPRWRDGEIRFEEWRPDAEGANQPPLRWFIGSALEELEKALASGGPVRVVPARQSKEPGESTE